MNHYLQIEALNWSALKYLDVSALMLRYRETTPREDTAALALGRAIHCAILEPERWRSAYIAQPDLGDGRTKEGKAAKAAWLASVPPGAEVLRPADYETAERCAAAVRAHPTASELIVGGRAEETIQWVDEETGIKCKARLDYVRPRGLLDVKSTRRLTVRQFLREASTLLYHGQLAWYHDGAITAGVLPIDAELPLIVAPQTSDPYDVSCYRMTRMAYLAGRSLWRTLIQRYAECQAANWFPGIAPTLLDFEVEPWAAGMSYDEEESEAW